MTNSELTRNVMTCDLLTNPNPDKTGNLSDKRHIKQTRNSLFRLSTFFYSNHTSTMPVTPIKGLAKFQELVRI